MALPTAKYLFILITTCIAVAFPMHFVFAQSEGAIERATGIDSDVITIVLQAVIVPGAGTLLAFWVNSRKKDRDNQWSALNESRTQLLKDRDDALKALREKDEECDALRDKITGLIQELSMKESRVAILTYRLQQYEQVTGEVPKE